MSSYPPPIENVALFDTTLFKESSEAVLTVGEANKRYLRYPTAQGTETLQAVNVNGIATFESDVTVKERVYQELESGSAWSATQGYYALDKQKQPIFNPASNGVKAVSSWTLRSASSTANWISVCWSPQLRLFAACSYTSSTNRIMTSPDGYTWTTQTTPSAILNGICWSPELGIFVAVGGSSTQSQIYYSSDGVTWTSSTVAGLTIALTNVCWSPQLSRFVAVANNGVSTNRIIYSSNGIDWTYSTSLTSIAWTGVTWSPQLGRFVCVGPAGSTRLAYSDDGITWTAANNTGMAVSSWSKVCWSPELGIYCTVASTSTLASQAIATSPDGVNWTLRTAPNTNTMGDICWAAEIGQFITVSYGGTADRVSTSSDGINWVARTPATTNSWFGICWAPELSMAVSVAYSGSSSTQVMTNTLKGRNPTSYNVFDGVYNSIDENGNWTYNRIQFSGNSGVRIGQNSGLTSQATDCIAIGQLSGNSGQKSQSIAIGRTSGNLNQGASCVAVGRRTGETDQGDNAVALGPRCGESSQGTNAVAVGNACALEGQGSAAIAIGNGTGVWGQGTAAIAIGQSAGLGTQNNVSTYQGSNAIAIGTNSGAQSQGSNGIAIGNQAAQNGQGTNAVAIGTLSGQTNQHASSIILNASGSALNSDGTSRFYVNPIRNATNTNMLGYNATTKEVTYYTPTNINPYYGEFTYVNDQALSSGIIAQAVLNTNVVTNGFTRTVNEININKDGMYKIGLTLNVNNTGAATTMVYGITKNSSGITASTRSVLVPASSINNVYYIETMVSLLSTDKISANVFPPSSGNLTLKTAVSPGAPFVEIPAVLLTIFEIL